MSAAAEEKPLLLPAAGPGLLIRLKRHLLQYGPQSLTTTELLGLLLGPGGNPWGVAAGTLEALGGLEGLSKASAWQLRRQTGIGDGRATRVLCAMELAARRQRDTVAADPIASPGHSHRYFAARLANFRRESFGCLYLDTRHRPIDFQILFQGTVDSAAVYPREVLRHCLERDASAVVVGHNHPSGDPHPSHADITITTRLKDALSLLDIRLLDHLIIAGSRVYSFAEHGRI